MSSSERDDWTASDERLLEELRAAMGEPDAHDDEMVRAAQAVFAWRDVEQQVERLVLTFDSLSSDTSLVRGSSDGAGRVLVFDSEALTLELEVSSDVLVGQVVPGHRERIAMDGPRGRIDETETDDSGYFLLRRPLENPVRFVVHDRPGLVTEWTIL